jgi:hypothetical protein
MHKEYRCLDCNKKSSSPTYLRLHLTACGWKSISQLPRWQRSIPVGHFCEDCLLSRVRTATGLDFDLSQAERHPRRANVPADVRTQEESL